MSETSKMPIAELHKDDIFAPAIEPGGTAIIMQRHERYNRDRNAEDAGSISSEAAAGAYERDLQVMDEILEEEDGAPTMFLFVSSDTQYAGKGHRSMETGEVAQLAAKTMLEDRGIDPATRILNLNDAFDTVRHDETNRDIVPMPGIREPQIFDEPDYVAHLREKYGKEDGPGTGMSPRAWAMHEMDAEAEVRMEIGAEGVYDILDRTKDSIATLRNFAVQFHAENPGARLVIWATSHYDTLSPLTKDATGQGFDTYLPVDYGAGAVMHIAPNSSEVVLQAQDHEVALKLGQGALNATQRQQ